MSQTAISLRTVEADGVEVFYREAGRKDAPVLLLLHGFPNSSHMFRGLMPLLSERFRLIAPDFPGFGFTAVPAQRAYTYSFASLSRTLGAFIEALELKRYVLYVFDYGAPIGFRHAIAHPEQIAGVISQNGNAYEEGLGPAWAPIREHWGARNEGRSESLRTLLTLDQVREGYLDGMPDPAAVAPETWWLDAALMARPGNAEIQVSLMVDYASNVGLYPKFQAWLRERKPPMLAIWGRHDPFFLPAGAVAFQRDVPDARVQFLNAGHFALETELHAIAQAIREVVPGFFV